MRRLLVVGLLYGISFNVTLAAVPLWAVAQGAHGAHAGLTVSALLVTTLACQPIAPSLVLVCGAGRILALGAAALGAPVLLFPWTSDLWAMSLVSSMRGVGFGLVTVTSFALTMKVATPGRRGGVVGLFGLTQSLPSLVFAPAGVLLAQHSLYVAVWLIAAVPLLAVPTALRLGRSVLARGRQKGVWTGAEPAEGARPVLRVLLAPSLPALCVTAAAGGLLTYLPIARPSDGLATTAILLMGLTGLLSRWMTGSWLDRRGGRVLAPVSCLCAGAGLTLVASGLSLPGTWCSTLVFAGASIFGCGLGMTQVVTLLACFARVDRRHAPVASAVWNFSVDAGMVAGAAGLGVLASTALGVSGAVATAALIVSLVTPVAARVGRSVPSRPGPTAANTQ